MYISPSLAIDARCPNYFSLTKLKYPGSGSSPPASYIHGNAHVELPFQTWLMSSLMGIGMSTEESARYRAAVLRELEDGA